MLEKTKPWSKYDMTIRSSFARQELIFGSSRDDRYVRINKV